MSPPPNDTPPTTPNEWVPQWVPSGSQKAPRAHASRVGPVVPISSIGTHSASPHPVGPTSGSQDHFNTHLLQAANVAKITGDAPGTMAVLMGCPRCSSAGRS